MSKVPEKTLAWKPEWLNSGTVLGDTLVSFYWERKPDVSDKRNLSTDDIWDLYDLMVIGNDGLYQYREDGFCVRAKSTHPIDD